MSIYHILFTSDCILKVSVIPPGSKLSPWQLRWPLTQHEEWTAQRECLKQTVQQFTLKDYSYKIAHVTKHIQNPATCTQQFANRIHGINYMLEISLNSSDLHTWGAKVFIVRPQILLNNETVETRIWSLCTLPLSKNLTSEAWERGSWMLHLVLREEKVNIWV